MEKDRPSRKRFLTILGLQIVLILGVGVYFLVDFEKLSFFGKDKDKIFIKQDESCNLHQASCTINLNDKQKITFSISPKHIPLMKPLVFEVMSENIHENSLNLKIYATNMNMGIHNFALKKIAPNRYKGTGVLPTCIVGDMVWNADIVSKGILDKKAARFTFKTDI